MSNSAQDTNESINQLFANIKVLQDTEMELNNQLMTMNSSQDKRRLINQIDQLAQVRQNLYESIAGIQSGVRTDVTQSYTTHSDQLNTIDIVDNRLSELKQRRTILDDKKTNAERMIEITNYYGKKYKFQIETLKIISIVLLLGGMINILRIYHLISSIIYIWGISIIIFIGLYVILERTMDMTRRDNTDFDQYAQ